MSGPIWFYSTIATGVFDANQLANLAISGIKVCGPGPMWWNNLKDAVSKILAVS
jgi:hypothetical protein